MALRRCRTTENNLLDYIPKGITMLPNTSGARNAEEAVRIARLAREVCQTDFVKVEIEHETKYLLPDNEETIRATEMLAKEGFVVMPYMFPDPIAAKRLEDGVHGHRERRQHPADGPRVQARHRIRPRGIPVRPGHGDGGPRRAVQPDERRRLPALSHPY